jgi:molybdate transport system substrate-binding protein
MLAELSEDFEAETGVELSFTFAASGTLASQIREGAPIDVFLSANAGFMEELANDGFVVPDSLAHFADGVLVMVGSIGSPLDSHSLPGNQFISHVAVANPELAPYGAAAKRFLEDSGQWRGVEAKIVFGESVLQALQFVRSGNADVGFVPRSLVIPNLPSGITSVQEITEADRLAQTVGVVSATDTPLLAGQFVDFLASSPLVGGVLAKNGYQAPRGGRAQ